MMILIIVPRRRNVNDGKENERAAGGDTRPVSPLHILLIDDD